MSGQYEPNPSCTVIGYPSAHVYPIFSTRDYPLCPALLLVHKKKNKTKKKTEKTACLIQQKFILTHIYIDKRNYNEDLISVNLISVNVSATKPIPIYRRTY